MEVGEGEMATSQSCKLNFLGSCLARKLAWRGCRQRVESLLHNGGSRKGGEMGQDGHISSQELKLSFQAQPAGGGRTAHRLL